MKQLLEALQAVMLDVGYVQRTGLNTYSKTTYATQEDILAALRPSMLTHGLFLIGPRVVGPERVVSENVYIQYEWDLAHISGEIWPHPIGALGCGRNTKGFEDRGAYKAATGAQRYALLKLFQLATGDDPEAVDPADYDAVPGQAISRAAENGIAHAARADAPPADTNGLVSHLAASANAKRSKRERLLETTKEHGMTATDLGEIIARLEWPTSPKDLTEDQVSKLITTHIPALGASRKQATAETVV